MAYSEVPKLTARNENGK